MTNQQEPKPALRDLRQAPPATREAFFDRWASTYDGDLIAKGYRAPWLAADSLAELMPGRDQLILDAGCGTGLVGERLSERGFTALVGVDSSLESLDIAKKKRCYGRLVCRDLDKTLEFEDNIFAAVLCIGTITYVRDPETLLREFCRVTREGGYISFTQRTDLYDHAFIAIVEQITRERLWDPVSHSPPLPYVPKHESFGDNIHVHYDIYRVCEGGRAAP